MASKSGLPAREELGPVARACVVPTTKSANSAPSAHVTRRRTVLVLIVVSFRGSCSRGGLLSSCLPSAGNFGDEESLGFYREDEAHPAARFPSTCDLEGTLVDLDDNAYHLCALLSLEDAHAASHSGMKSGTGSPKTSTSR